MKQWQILLWVLVLGLIVGPLGVGCSSEKDSEEQGAETNKEDGTKRISGAFSPATPVKGVVGDLVKRLPNNTLGFITTSGGAVLSDQFKQSHLGMLWNDPGVQQFRQSIETELMKLLEQEEGEEGKVWFDLIKNNVLLALNQPLLIGVAEKPTGQPEGPPVYGFAILDAGPNKAEIDAALTKIETMAGEEAVVNVKIGSYTFHGPKDTDDVPGYWGWVDNYLVFAINDGEGLAIQNLISAAGASQPAVKALEKVHAGNDILAMHINIEKSLKLIQMLIDMEGGDEANMVMGKMEAVLVDLGLKDIKSITSRMGFAGTDMISEAWVEVPQPFTGLLKCLKPVNMQQFDLVEKRAFTASIINADLAGVFDAVMETIRRVAPPRDYQDVQEGLAEFEQEIGIKIRDGLLASLAGPTVVYSLPPDINATSGAFAMMLELKDAGLMARSLGALEQFVSAQLDQEMPIKGMLQISTVPLQDKTLHVWTIPFLSVVQITPCWMIVDNQLVIVSNPAVARSALQHLTNPNRGSNSIRQKPTFQQVAQNPPQSMLSFGYVESGVLLRQVLSIGQRVWPLVTMAAKEGGLNLPALLPTLDQIIAEMGPAHDCLWTASDGFYVRSRGPISTGAIGMGVGVLGMGAGFVLPSFMFVSRTSAIENNAEFQMVKLEMALSEFYVDCGRFPTEAEELEALLDPSIGIEGWDGPYLKMSDLTDPWGNPYQYVYPSKHGEEFDIISYGRDGQPSGSGPDADIINGERMDSAPSTRITVEELSSAPEPVQ